MSVTRFIENLFCNLYFVAAYETALKYPTLFLSQANILQKNVIHPTKKELHASQSRLVQNIYLKTPPHPPTLTLSHP